MAKNLAKLGAPTNWDTAKKLIGLYNKHNGRLRTVHGTPDLTLSGFTIPVSDLDKVMISNDPKVVIKDIFIALGYNDGSIKEPTMPTAKKGFTAIIIGIDEDGKLVTSTTQDIQDYLDPCPDNCPILPDNLDYLSDIVYPEIS